MQYSVNRSSLFFFAAFSTSIDLCIYNSNNPNVFAYSFRKQIVISPLKVIQSGKELLLNYNDVIIEQQRAKNNTRRTRRPTVADYSDDDDIRNNALYSDDDTIRHFIICDLVLHILS